MPLTDILDRLLAALSPTLATRRARARRRLDALHQPPGPRPPAQPGPTLHKLLARRRYLRRPRP